MNKNKSNNQDGEATITDQKKNEVSQSIDQILQKNSPLAVVKDESVTVKKNDSEKEHQDKEHQHDFKTPEGTSNTAMENSESVEQGEQDLNKDVNQSSDRQSKTK